MSNWISIFKNCQPISFFFNTRLTPNHDTIYDKQKHNINETNTTHDSNFYKARNNFEFFINWEEKFSFIATKSVNLWAWTFKNFIWMKARVLYYINNWVYTTNHKRIAVNYFWFVIFAGICGMVLATIIRLEMAYPGVGILAGDSLQYLSVVTAHAVIMVFFMIMPLLFGAFGNFLLPTQLGVHDVAFPRLNSAAFWFLPAGLIMLCQLVCLDRRYQRMNCFNIREIQAILKGRFFNDLVNSEDHHDFLDKTSIGLRFKTNNLDSINPNMLLFFRHGVNSNAQSRFQLFSTETVNWESNKEFFNNQSYFPSLINYFNNNFNFELIKAFYNTCFIFFTSFSKNSCYYYENISGKSSFFGFFEVICNYSVHKADKQINNIFHVLNLNEPFWLFTNYYWNFIPMSVENLTFGWMDNNMGHHKIRRILRPTYTHPEIITSESLPYMMFTIVHSLASRSIFIPFRGVLLNHELMKQRWAAEWNSFMSPENNLTFQETLELSNSSMESIKNNSLLSFINNTSILFFELIKNLINTFLQIVNFMNWNLNISNLKENTFSILTKLFNIELLLGLTNTNFTFLEKLNFNFFKAEVLTSNDNNSLYVSHNNTTTSINDKILFGGEETSLNFRYQKFQNPIFRYDYKAGNYFTKSDLSTFPHMFTTASELTGGIRKSSWYFSELFLELFDSNFNNYMNNFSKKATGNDESYSVNISHTHGFFNFFNLLSNENNFINHRWLAINAMDQKFYKMFTTSSMQQRIYANWRQLKFTREAWRCKLLAARHQKTMYRRYLNEDGVVWAAERNAKDVLPGWAMITPFSGRARFTAIGKVDIGLMGVFLVLNSSIVSSANFLVTYRYLSTLNNRKMRDARSFFTEGVMVASWMMIAANPMLAIGILMLLSDRHWQTSFFDYSGGGDTVLFQHMFWFFGHPEVYVVMIPAFGFNNTILSFYLRKRVSARASLLYSMYTIAFLGFFVWGHHMYMVGLAHTTRMLFSTLTVMISVPAATKLMHWCVTLANSAFSVELPFIFSLLFIFFFVSGGISGMAVAHTGMDILFHDSFYVIGHFHVMFAGSAMFASFGAFYFYFPSIFGVKFSRIWGYLHCVYYLLGQLMTVIPMFWLGYSGMPRRVLDYPASLGGWHAITSAGHLLSVAGLLAFFIMIFDSLRQGRPALRNSLGVSRFNTRLNFYLYEIARIRLVQRKGWSVSRYNQIDSVQLNKLNYTNHELLEVTMYSYRLVQK